MTSEDYNYFRARALEERERAATSKWANIHLSLAAKYEALAKKAEVAPTLRSGWDSPPTAETV